MLLRLTRRDLLKIGGLGLATSVLGQKADAAALFGRMFAVPPRDTTYFTSNEKFYVVNYSDSPFSLSRDVRIDQWRLSITGAVKLPMALSYGDILQRPAIDRAVTLECIDNLPGGDSMGTPCGVASRSKRCWKKSAPIRRWPATSCSGPLTGTTTASRSTAPWGGTCCSRT